MKTRMRGEERYAAIVRSAIRLFAEKGFRGATTRELASALGVTEPVLYRHFPTKRDLYNAIIEAKAEQASERVHTLRRYAEAGDDKTFFTRLGELILETSSPARSSRAYSGTFMRSCSTIFAAASGPAPSATWTRRLPRAA